MPPRLDPLPPEHSPELKQEFNSFLKSLGFVPNSVLTMQRRPALVRAFVALQGAIWGPESKVDRGLKRMIGHVASTAARPVLDGAYRECRHAFRHRREEARGRARL